MMKKTLTLVLAVTAAAMLLASCSKKDQGAAAAAPSAAQKETIVIGGWPAGDTAFKAIIGMFNAEYPDIEVVIGNFMPSDDYHNELQASIAAGSGAPDVAMLEQKYVGMYKDASGFENLLDAPYNAGSMKNDFTQYKWDLATSVDGKKLVGLVWDIGPASLFYNSEVFAQAGLPTEPAEVEKYLGTWDGFLDAAEKVYIPNRRWLVCSAADLFTWNFMNRDFYQEDLRLVLDKPGAMDALNAAITMRKNGWDAQIGIWDNEAYSGIGDGSIATVVAGCWYGGFLKSWIAPDSAGKWRICRLPGGIQDSNWGGSYLTIPSQSRHKEAAWTFIKFALATKQAQNAMFEAVDYFPGYIPAWSDPLYIQGDPYFGGQNTRALWVDIAKNIKPSYSTLMDPGTEDALGVAVGTGLSQGKNAAEIIQMVRDQVAASTQQDRDKYIDILKQAGKM
ncbi:MAG: extracellular solute-binding protein [Treponema sp.]|nr:extracellular solute-binding protein [Treponema sp.]